MGSDIVKYNGFDVDLGRLEKVFESVNSLMTSRKGIFQDGLKQYLPQWNLPKELEYDPQQKEVVNPELAGRFLFTRVFIDRISLSSIVHQSTLKLWYDSKDNWIFNPKEAVKRTPEEIGNILRSKLYYNVPLVNGKRKKDSSDEFKLTAEKVLHKPQKSAGEGYWNNARLVSEQYDNDPRNLIRYKTVAQARELLQKADGFGSGIANLYLIECANRLIAVPLDLENLRPKIDRHKSRIPLNTEVVTLKNGVKEEGRIHANTLVKPLETAYLEIAKKLGFDLTDIDAGLWIIGSQVCKKVDMNACRDSCPLHKDGLCTAYTPLGHDDGYFRVYDENGNRLDPRKSSSQLELLASDMARPKSS